MGCSFKLCALSSRFRKLWLGVLESLVSNKAVINCGDEICRSSGCIGDVPWKYFLRRWTQSKQTDYTKNETTTITNIYVSIWVNISFFPDKRKADMKLTFLCKIGSIFRTVSSRQKSFTWLKARFSFLLSMLLESPPLGNFFLM